MGKLELGSKHVCAGCGTRYYDLQRAPATCPKCGTAELPEVPLKTRRARSHATHEEEPAEPLPEMDIDPAAIEAEGEIEADTEDEEEEIIEDASELGEDKDDMAEVVETEEE